MLEGAGCHYDLFGFEAPTAQAQAVVIVFSAERVYWSVQPNGELEAGGVCLQVTGHCILGQECIGRRRERHPWQTAVPSRGEKPQRIPTLAPAGAASIVGVEDHKVSSLPAEV